MREKTQIVEGPTLSAALSEAQNIVEAARQRAAELIEQASQSYEQAKERGYQDGYQAGYAKAAESAVRLIEESSTISEKLSAEAARLALAIAGTVISEQIKLEPELVQNIARRALQESVNGELVTVVVSPEDREALNGAADNLRRLAGGAKVAIESDDNIARGGCIVRTDFGEVDATIEALLKVIASRLGLGT